MLRRMFVSTGMKDGLYLLIAVNANSDEKNTNQKPNLERGLSKENKTFVRHCCRDSRDSFFGCKHYSVARGCATRRGRGWTARRRDARVKSWGNKLRWFFVLCLHRDVHWSEKQRHLCVPLRAARIAFRTSGAGGRGGAAVVASTASQRTDFVCGQRGWQWRHKRGNQQFSN